jgi:hypothetical protein
LVVAVGMFTGAWCCAVHLLPFLHPLLLVGCRAVYHKGVGGPGLSRYLKEANSEVEVWLQVGTAARAAAAAASAVAVYQ